MSILYAYVVYFPSDKVSIKEFYYYYYYYYNYYYYYIIHVS